MLEAKLEKAGILKHVLDAVKELVTDVNFNCNEDGIKLQAMDNSHVALVALQLRTSGFSQFRCDRTMTLGISVASFQKMIKGASNDDILTLRAHDDGDLLNIVFETLSTDRVAEYELKLMDIDIEHLGIPDTIYDAEITLPSSEFNRIIRDLKEMGESVRIEATKEGVTFSANGDSGKGSVMLKHTAGAAKEKPRKVVDVDSDDENEVKEDDTQGDEAPQVKAEKEVEEDEEFQPEEEEGGGEEEEEEEANGENADSDDDQPRPKKRKLAKKSTEKATNGKKKATKKKEEKEKEEVDMSVCIALQTSVSLTFSIKYLSNFTKATPLAGRVTLHMSNEVPLLVAYEFETGYVRYYLAPKIEDDP